MKRTLLVLTLAVLALAETGCTSFCRHLFGLDRRCEQPPPCYNGPAVYGAPPVAGPAVQYGPPGPAVCAPPH